MVEQEVVVAEVDVPLAPEEVLHQTFPRALMGYDRSEVDYFLELLALQQKRLLDQVRSAATTRPEPRSAPDDARLAAVLEAAARVVGDRRRAYHLRRQDGHA